MFIDNLQVSQWMTLQRLFEGSVHAGVDYVLNQVCSSNIVISLRQNPSAITNEFLGSHLLIQVQFWRQIVDHHSDVCIVTAFL